MFQLIGFTLSIIFKISILVFHNKSNIILENIVLKQQLANYKAKDIKPKINDEDRFFWVTLYKDTPKYRYVQNKPIDSAKIIALPRFSGLHHRYEWQNRNCA